ncbi:hypothetical protein BBP40_010186 [Aspergillus hancockii]|nr:hypothetical protein BBP40_010186 [Aspergillus hancockii]
MTARDCEKLSPILEENEMVIQFLATLPHGFTYVFLRNGAGAQKGSFQWPAEFKGGQSPCVLYNVGSHDPVQYAVDAGCSGVKVDIQVEKEELYAGAMPKALDTLRDLYLKPLVDKLDARNAAEVLRSSTSEFGRVGLLDEDPTRPFTLVLKLHSWAESALPQLVRLLESLKEKGYLSIRNGTQFVSRPVTVVLAGQNMANFGDMFNPDGDRTHNSIVLDISLEDLVVEDYGSVVGTSETSLAEMDDYIQSKGASDNSLGKYQMLTATVNFTKSIGFPHRGGRFSQHQIERVRAQVQAAHRRGLRARYEGISSYSQTLQRVIWRVLVHEGADLIEVDWTRCELPWWRRFVVAGDMHCHGRTGDISGES